MKDQHSYENWLSIALSLRRRAIKHLRLFKRNGDTIDRMTWRLLMEETHLPLKMCRVHKGKLDAKD